MGRAFIGVGANLEPEQHVRAALERLGRGLKVTGISSFYRTRPEDRPEQPEFVNGVVEVETSEPPERLRALLREIEEELGRRRTGDKNAPREIDLDLLVYDQLVLDTSELVLPDRSIARRPFLAVPLAELAPELRLPGETQTLRQLALPFARSSMTFLPELTAALRSAWRARGFERRSQT